MTFAHPVNGHVQRVGPAWLWALLFGAFYYAYKGMWRHAALLIVLVIPTLGLAWLWYAVKAPALLREHYLERGWIPQ
jgi:hypothetical protein